MVFLADNKLGQRGAAAITLGLLLAFGISAHYSKLELRKINKISAEQPIYLPDARYVRLITLGFDRFASNILWFHTINYFGKAYQGDKDYRWLYQMCELVTELNENATHVVEFCATLLSWEVKNARASNAILDKAIETAPTNWRYHYLRGFNNWYFLNEKEKAKRDFFQAAKLPHAPPFLASIASRLMISQNEINNAIALLENIIKTTSDHNARAALRAKLKLAYITRDSKLIEKQLVLFQKRHKRNASSLRELVADGLLKKIPLDPFGKPYRIENDKIVAGSGHKGLDFSGKTAKTGIMKHLF